jgi:hypothetical protein
MNAALELIRCSRPARHKLVAAFQAEGKPLRTQALWEWVKRGKIPPLRVPTVARVLGIPAYLIRPDLPQLFPGATVAPRGHDGRRRERPAVS